MDDSFEDFSAIANAQSADDAVCGSGVQHGNSV